MVYLLYVLLVILLDFKNYANTEKEAETPACCGALAVAQTSWWTNCSFCRATTDPLQEIEWSSLKRCWIPSQAQESHGRSVQTTLAMPLVQEAQQAPCQRLRILLCAVGEMHRHPLRAWTEESNCGSATFEFQKEVAAVSGLGEMGELGRLAAKTVRHPQTGLCAISEKAHKGQKEPKGQAQGANGAIWSTFTGSTLAVNCAGSFASACCDWECIISRRPSATRTCSSDRNLRQANLLRSSDGDGEGQESPGTTTTDCEVSSAGVGQVGEEEKTTPTSASGKSESPSILGSIYRGVCQKMANLCGGLRQERSKSGAKSSRSQRGNARGKGKIRQCESGYGEARPGTARASGCRRNLRWDGGRCAGEDCIIGSHPRRHLKYAIDAGQHQSATTGGNHGSTTQKASSRTRRRRWREIFTWCLGIDTFSQARQTDRRKEVCLGHLQPGFDQGELTIFQWTHSILDEYNFLNEWKASIDALDLQMEVSSMSMQCFANPTSLRQTMTRPRSRGRKVNFKQKIELYVGPEHGLQRWSHTLTRPIREAKIFQPYIDLQHDVISFMSAPAVRHDEHLSFGGETEDQLMNNQEVARDYELETDSSECESAASHAETPVQDWFAVLLFAADFQPQPMRVDWNDYETMHTDAAYLMEIPKHQLYYLHHVRTAPQDLKDAGVEALIGHRHHDLQQGSTLQLILMDVEFHSALPEIQPEVVRRVVKLPRNIGRLAILNRLGLGEYCRRSQQNCILWHNDDIISWHSARPLALSHGDYMRIAVPPGQEEVHHIATRCVATACHQGISIGELCNRHALFAAGWYDTIIGPPFVPLPPDLDGFSMLQLSVDTPPLEQPPWFLLGKQHCRINDNEPLEHFEDDPGDITRHIVISDQATPPGGIHPNPELDRQPEHVHNLLGQLEEHGLLEVEEEGRVLYVVTWFLNFPQHARCTASRTVRLTTNFAQWNNDFLRAWRELLEPGQAVEFFLVFPQPPSTRMQPAVLPHLILLQRSPEARRAAVITTVDSRFPTDHFDHVALFVPLHAGKQEVIAAADKIEDCYPSVSDLQCMTWHGDQQLQDEQGIVTHHGIAFLLIIQDMRRMTQTAWDDDEQDALHLMQHGRIQQSSVSRASTSFHWQASGLNPAAPVFDPHRPSIQALSEPMQDLHHLWEQHAHQCEEADRFIDIEVWFVDHARKCFQCDASRKVRLHEDFSSWEAEIEYVWNDYRVTGETLEYHLVDPMPSYLHPETAAHMILIQSPHAQLVTSLLTFYEGTRGAHHFQFQNAITTHEHIWIQHLAQGLNVHRQCFGPNPTSNCQVWYGEHIFQVDRPWPARSGYALDFELLQRVEPADRSDATVLLQLQHLITPNSKRLTHGKVAQTHGPLEGEDIVPPDQVAVKLCDLAGLGNIPAFVEVPYPGTAEQVRQELRHWGHDLLTLDCWPQPAIACCPLPLNMREHNYLFCRHAEEAEKHIFAHTHDQLMSEQEILTFLCQLDYPRAVVLAWHELCAGWIKIVFSHQEPQMEQFVKVKSPGIWPPPPPGCTESRSKLIDLADIENPEGASRLHTDITVADLHNLFASGNDMLCRNFTCFDLPEFVREEMEIYNTDEPLPDLSLYDRILIFTDGTSAPEMRRIPTEQADELGKPDAWAFLVVGELHKEGNSTFHPIGWTSQVVRYSKEGSHYNGVTKIGSDLAERSALTWAGMWRLSQNIDVETLFCTDSLVSGAQAFGEIGVGEAEESFRLQRSVFQALKVALPEGNLGWHHIKSHTGNTYNEFVDLAAKWEVAHGFHQARQAISMTLWRKALPYLWMVFAGPRWGLPAWKNGSFEIPPPQLPDLQRVPQSKQSCAYKTRLVNYAFSFASANVHSLSRAPEGHAGKLHYLFQQMRSFKLNCIGIQEARTEQGVACSHNILRLSSGHSDKQLGVELWLDLDMPIGHSAKGRPICLQRSDVQVVHADARRLMAKIDHPAWSAWIVVLHAPHSGYTGSIREAWWQETHDIVASFHDEDPLFVLMDANAPPGEADGHVVFQDGFSTATSTTLMRTFLQTHGLCLPATCHSCHRGEHGTWIDLRGEKWHCIDHIAVPAAWLCACTHSQVLDEFDLATTQEDHKVVALQLKWSATYAEEIKKGTKRLQNTQGLQQTKITHLLQEHRPVTWETDIEQHLEAFNADIQAALQSHAAEGEAGHSGKKLYFDAAIWEHRREKLRHRATLKALRKKVSQEMLQLCFSAWKRKGSIKFKEATYLHTLHCWSFKHWIAYRRKAQILKHALSIAKQQQLDVTLQAIDSSTPASDIIRKLRSFTGPTNPKKIKKKTLPLVMNEAGEVCAYPAEALGVWINYFMQMEGGKRMSHEELRRQWILELGQFARPDLHISIHELPTLTDLEISYRRVPGGRAQGPDNVPGELCKYQAAPLALASFAHLAKLVCHGQEYLGHKGGQLTPAYKGKGMTSCCSSYRSLLVSSNIGKVLHRTLRQANASLYETFMQAQQVGGRRKVPVQLALDQVRAFLRQARRSGHSAGILFLDLTEAFYRILRELSLGGEPTDETVAHVMKRLNMPHTALHDIHQLLCQQSALQQAGLSETARNYTAAVHSGTHFWLQGQGDVAKTCMGTRPGDSFADVVFGYTWSLVMKKLQDYMVKNDLVDPYHGRTTIPLFDTGDPSQDQNIEPYIYLGPTWMDDLALCLQGKTPQQMESRIGHATSCLLDLCHQHLMSPNLAKGKTEMLLIFRGTKSRTFKEKHYGMQSVNEFPVLTDQGLQKIRIIKSYKHLGGWIHHRTDQRMELAQKTALAHAAFSQHRRLLYANQKIAFEKRAEIFTSLVLTKLLYGADSWMLDTKKDVNPFHVSVIRLYKRLIGWKPDMQLTDEDIIAATGLPAPDDLLRRIRLRYLVVLCNCGIPEIWSILAQDQEWCQQVEEDLVWMWEQLKRSSALKDPREHFPQWILILQDHRSYWKKLVNRACHHATLQRKKVAEVCALHRHSCARISTLMGINAEAMFPEPCDGARPGEETFGCMTCGISCRSKAGEGAHMFRVHGLKAWSRQWFDEPTCPACLRFFHTMAKTKAHLYYSPRCRAQLVSRNMQCGAMAGTGSLEDKAREAQHDFLLPPSQCQGPMPQTQRAREPVLIDDGLHLQIVELIDARTPVAHLREALCTYVNEHPISWTMWKSTLLFFMDTFGEEDAQFFQYDKTQLSAALGALLDPQQWPFLQQSRQSQEHQHFRTIAMCHEHCHQLLQQVSNDARVPRSFGRHRYVLHSFSGRRRLGDLQYFLEKAISRKQSYVLHVISLDIVVNSTWGNISKEHTREYWLNAIRARWVLAFLGGPPCESWSRARAVGHEAIGHFKPRVLRDMEFLWGFESVSVRELTQLLIGNCLLGFSFAAMIELAATGGFGLLEHPAEPDDLPTAASIWRLPLLRLILQLPGMQKCRLAQGLMGAPTPKPTDLLTLNMDGIMIQFNKHRIRKELPKARAIGKHSDGHWKTSVLKEYPPSMCQAIARTFISAFDECPVDTDFPDPPKAFTELCMSVECTDYGTRIGADFAK